MPLTTDAYFTHIKACMNPNFIQDAGTGETITLIEKIDGMPKALTVEFAFEGQAFSVNLDLKSQRRGDDIRLFRFLHDDAKPWAKKCDFIIFHRMPVGIYAYLIEFKSNGINQANIKAQLDASTNWLKSLSRVVENYFGHTHKLIIQKYVFSSNTNPGAYLDTEGKYLNADPAIRFYHYDDLKGLSLADLENNMSEEI